MKYSNIALKILSAIECGRMPTNAEFWKNCPSKRDLEESFMKYSDIDFIVDRLSEELDASYSDGGIVCVYDDEFPVVNPKAKNSEKPYLLFYRGDISLLKNLNKNVAVIGLIDTDEDIKKRETNIVEQLVNNNAVIVSGLAHGCDTIAHKVCVGLLGKTIAILPTQINKIYPAENRELAEDIVKTGGLLLSEYYKEPAGRYEATKRFIERDRLQAMFSKAIILIASYRKDEGDSGSRHAMEAANRYGIERFTMYNSEMDGSNKRFGLNHELIKKGVKVLQTSSIHYIKEIKNLNLENKYMPILLEFT